ncbi:hypothetical protein LTR66_013283 [Elasticomyces elasticus]|nr:hypothetical protein LTR66_013283 [Elasticomyces elasticus]
MPRRRRPARPGALADLAPLRILTQIGILQVLYYVCAAVLILFTTLVMGNEVKLDLLFSWRSLRGDITIGWMLGLCWMMDSLICVLFLLLFIARSKLVPDFALTIHLVHLIVTSLYTHALPTNLFWWAVQLASAGLMTFLGVWACRWRELKPIAFGGQKAGGQPGTASADGQQDLENATDDGDGFTRGAGRGRGADGAGTYEMVGMAPRGGNG